MDDSNVIVLVMDTAKAAALGEVRDHQETAISEIASDGVEYTNATAAAPWSLPSHASLLTGTYPSKHGAHAGYKKLESSVDVPYLPSLFERHGYETVGISNNTWISEEFGFAEGFETFYKTWQYVQSETDLGEIARTEEGIDKFRALARRIVDGNPITNVANAVYGQFLRKQEDDGAKRTNEWVYDWLDDRDDSRPFFLFINYLEPHLEYRPPETFADPFLPSDVAFEEAMDVSQDAWSYIAGNTDLSDRELEALRGLYRGELAYLDHRIGELRQLLEDAGEWEKTILVITGDHGENIGDHGLMDHQYCLYETLLHVPLIVHGGSFTGGIESDRLVQLTDLPPTLLDAARIDADDAREAFQGRSFHPDAETDPRSRAIAEYLAPQPSMEALEKRVDKLPNHVYEYDRSLRSIRSDGYKLVLGSDGSRELYYLPEDSDERYDRVEDQPETVADLETEIDEWLESFKHAESSGSVTMTDSTKNRLEDLGYLQ
ncbi:sulfatase [Saliphagus infecundisoli]|uniref:Sulfatase n=1 Tax=Saliphagus infecundisoli TaxID=1849069 RepID=A0ABD5QIU9_9EURY|nr:sulfatase [Saliphagus infecundisoli]